MSKWKPIEDKSGMNLKDLIEKKVKKHDGIKLTFDKVNGYRYIDVSNYNNSVLLRTNSYNKFFKWLKSE